MGTVLTQKPTKAANRQKRPSRYTFRIDDGAELLDFARRQKVPDHDRPKRRQREERWTLAHYFLALEAAGRLTLPIRAAHALGNQAPDFLIGSNNHLTEGIEITHATTRKHENKLQSLERSKKARPARGFDLNDGKGWTGHQRETYWCFRVLKAARSKLAKLGKGHYEKARVQHLVIYDSMGVMGVNLPEAVKRVKPKMVKALSAASVRFSTVSVVSDSGYVLYDLAGACESLLIPYLPTSQADIAHPSP